MYFPVSPRPLQMTAGLTRFGTDFGNGARDREFFQLDAERARYLTAKRRAPAERRVVDESPAAAAARAAALGWIRAELAARAPVVLREAAQDSAARDDFDAL